MQAPSRNARSRRRKGKLRSFAAAMGHIRQPVAGKVVQMFGGGRHNETSKGIVIATRAARGGHGALRRGSGVYRAVP